MKLDETMVKVFKFVTFVFFSFAALLYVGILLLLPLDILFQLIRIFHAIGLPTVISVALGIGAIGYLGLAVSKMPALCGLMIDIGKQLVEFGHGHIKRFDELLPQTTEAEAAPGESKA